MYCALAPPKHLLALMGITIFFLINCIEGQAKGLHYGGIDIPDQSGQAMTVLGSINPDKLGDTLMHEHLFIDFWLPKDQPHRWARFGNSKPPSGPEELEIWHKPFAVRDRANLLSSRYFLRNRDGFTLDNKEDAINEVLAYQQLGGGTIVDVTVEGLNPQPEELKNVSLKTGINIVMGTGFYRRAFHPEDMAQRSLSDLTMKMVRDIVEGAGNTGVKAGIIGEIPAEHLVFEPEESDEVRVLRAAAHASQLTGAAISLHSDFGDMNKLHTSIDILEEEGADLSRVVMGHIAQKASADILFLESLLQRGVYLQFDVLSGPWNIYDGLMMDAIAKLISHGYSRKILVSHDVCSKHGLVKNGGYGFTFVHLKLIPYLLSKGVNESAIKNIIEENPRRVLTFVKPKRIKKQS